MKKELTNRDKQAIATKKKLYKTGVNMIQKHGIDGVNVTSIAKAAGVSVGTFYHYYTSKLDLFMDMYRQADAYYENELPGKLETLSFAEKIHLFFDEYASMAETNGIQLTQKMYVPENSLFISREAGMHEVLKSIIAKAQADGECAESQTPDDISDELFITARGVVFDWALHEGTYDLKLKLKKMLNIYMQSLYQHNVDSKR